MTTFRVRGQVNFRIPAKATDEKVAQAAIDRRRWERQFQNDAELGAGYGNMEGRQEGDQSLDLYIQLNNVNASSLPSAVAHGLVVIQDRLKKIDRELSDAYYLDVEASIQKVQKF